MNPALEYHYAQTRRQFFQGAGLKLGGLALASIMGERAFGAASSTTSRSAQVSPPLPGLPHFAPKAKRLIYLHMNGAPSQLDLFDYKPQLQKYYDKDLPDSIRNGQRITGMTSGQARFPVAPSLFKFSRCGKGGIWMSELVPHIQEVADHIAMIKS